MKISIREYQPEDIKAIVNFNRSITTHWNHYNLIKGEMVKGSITSPSNLSNFEQWYHGGPWNNAEIFEFYTKLVERSSGKIFLAWEGKNLVGELDCCLADNLGRAGYILWILTHPDKRMTGIGRKLIEKGSEFFKKKKVTHIAVSPEDEDAALFYKKVGFTDFAKGWCIELSPINYQSWKEIQKSQNLSHLRMSDLNNLGLSHMYPLIGSTRSNNYIVQTALNREEIIRILGKTMEESFLPPLWKYSCKKCIAIFGYVYQTRVWLNERALESKEFIEEILQLINSLNQENTKKEKLHILQVLILEKDINKLSVNTYKLISNEEIFSLKL